MRSVFISVLVILTIPVFANGFTRNENSNETSLDRVNRLAVDNRMTGVVSSASSDNDTIPSWLKGKFADDYRINYSISDSLWMQLPNTKFHIIKWNPEEQYLLAKNDTANPGEGGLYTRIDFMQFKGMEPFEWGFCLTAYQAPNLEAAEKTPAADRSNPRKGCGGFPFSRMKRTGNETSVTGKKEQR